MPISDISPDLARELVDAGREFNEAQQRIVDSIDRRLPRLSERVGTPIVAALSVMTTVAVMLLAVVLLGPVASTVAPPAPSTTNYGVDVYGTDAWIAGQR